MASADPTLGAIGLSASEESLYRLALGRAEVDAAGLAAELAMPGPAVTAALDRLLARGLLVRVGSGGLAAAPPAVALGALITDRREELRLAELAMAAYAEEHRTAAAGRGASELVEVVTGADGIRHRFLQVQAAARQQVRTFVTYPFTVVAPGDNPAESAAVNRGVRFRAVVERALLAEPGAVGEAVDSLRSGVEVRIADSLPMKLVIADADLALVPLAVTPVGEPAAVLLHRSGLLAGMAALFETVWRQAYPLELSGDAAAELAADAPTDLDRKILALLLAGLTDQAVSSQLGISMRTLQRRLRRLMDLAGVGSRMQLGWYAARHGWV
jgi:DNA-binding CsgD family transcriptional regulator